MEVVLGLGVNSFIFCFSIHYSLQIAVQLGVLAANSDGSYYRFPGLRALFSDNRRMLRFIVDYSFAVLFEHISVEILAVILLLSANPEFNISIWSVVSQMICFIYYLGYGLSAYFRHAASHLIVQNEYAQFKSMLVQSCKFFCVTLLMLFVLVFGFAQPFSRCFFDDSESVDVLQVCFRILSLFFVAEGFVTFLNSVLRLISEESFVFVVNFLLYMVFLPLSSFAVTYVYRTGAIVILLNFVVTSFIASNLFFYKLFKNSEKSFSKTYMGLVNENNKPASVDQDQKVSNQETA